MPGTTAEVKKMRGSEYGGMQFSRLSSTEILLRMCSAKDCAYPGKIQYPVPGGWRIACGRHAVLRFMLELGLFGDPSPVPEIQQYAQALGVNWHAVMESDPIHPTLPQYFRCLRCSGGLVERPISDFEIAYVHRCGEAA